MDRVDAKIENLHHTIAEFTASDEWANADILGKLGIAWDKIVAEPFDEWWNGSGRQFFADRAAGLGRGLGSGITAGFLALLGIDPAGAIDDGAAIGANFVSGFMDGLDFDGILDGLKTWAENHKAQVAAIGAVLGFKLVTGAASAYSKLRGLTAAFGPWRWHRHRRGLFWYAFHGRFFQDFRSRYERNGPDGGFEVWQLWRRGRLQGSPGGRSGLFWWHWQPFAAERQRADPERGHPGDGRSPARRYKASRRWQGDL